MGNQDGGPGQPRRPVRPDAEPALTVGGFEVVPLLDASGPFLPWAQAFPGATATDLAEARRRDPAAFGEDGRWHLAFRCFVVRCPDGSIALVDTGIGPADSPAASWAPVPGRLPEQLAAAGVGVADVGTVVVTHMHEDHGGGTVTGDGAPMFPNARYLVQRDEIAALEADQGAPMLSYAVHPLRRAGQLDQADGRHRLVAARGGTVTVVPTPGHSPGHQSVLVESSGQQVVVTGDVAVHAVQLVNPEVGYVFEHDQDVARHSRRRVLAAARSRGALLATAHLSDPFVAADGAGTA